jgi:F0F1-type ATP synthase assembly protein I
MADRPGDDSNLGRFASSGLQIGAGIGLGIWIGWLLEKRFPVIDPWGIVGGALLGIASGMYLLIRDALRANKD